MSTRTITGNVGTVEIPAAPHNTVNIRGPASGFLLFDGPSSDTVNITHDSIWSGGIAAVYAGVAGHVKGTGTWNLAGNTSDFGKGSTIGVHSITGTGTIIDSGDFGLDHGRLQFLHGTSVGEGIKLKIGGDAGGKGDVEIQSPSLFHGAITLGRGQFELDGLHGTSYSLKNDMLTIFNGDKIIESLRVSPTPLTHIGPSGVRPPVYPILVSQTHGGISVHANGSDYTGGGYLLPAHVG